MELSERLRRRAQMGWLYRRISPTVTLRRDLAAELLPEPRHLPRLCRAAAACLREEPLFGSRYSAATSLGLARGPILRVGVRGGERWVLFEDADRLGSELESHLDMGESALSRRSLLRGGLEVLDLSPLGIADWRGVVAMPLVARLVLLGRARIPVEGASTREIYPLLLDYDHRLADHGRAARFLESIENRLREVPS